MVATALAAVPGHRNGMAATPFLPRVPRCTRLFVWRTLAPLTELTGEASPPAMAPGRLGYCSGQPPLFSLLGLISTAHREINGHQWKLPFRA